MSPLSYTNKKLYIRYVGPKDPKVKYFDYTFTDIKLGMMVFNHLNSTRFVRYNGQDVLLLEREDLDFVAEAISKDKLAGRQFSLALDYGYDIEDWPTDEDEREMGMDDLSDHACYVDKNLYVAPRGYRQGSHAPVLVAREIIREVYRS